jgi:hypothetical protein
MNDRRHLMIVPALLVLFHVLFLRGYGWFRDEFYYYGEAGAVDVLGRAAKLPFALSGHNSYWFWGPGGFTGEVVIALTPSRERLEARFEDVQQVGTIECEHCMPYQNHRPLFVCRRPKQPLSAIWPQAKHFD